MGGARRHRGLTDTYLMLTLECDRPLAGSMRIGFDRASVVALGRGEARRHSHSTDDSGRIAVRVEVPDPRMSAAHALIERTDTGWWLSDRGSKNGTFVNGSAVSGAHLRDGDVVELGATFFRFRQRPAPERLAGAAGPFDPPAVHTLDPSFADHLAQVRSIASTDIPMLIRGEIGTGKEVTARAIHQLSGRSGPFVAINCGALPPSLIESELFGTVPGAYSGAEHRDGLIRSAEGGTLFLDEIAELADTSQVALLRVLQEGEVVPIGATTPIPVDVRFVAATHQHLAIRAELGEFRADLLSRLSGFRVELPPLRERLDDFGDLVATLLRAHGHSADVRLHRSAARALMRYNWPRNIRELETALRAALVLCSGTDISTRHLPAYVTQSGATEAVSGPGPVRLSLDDPETLRSVLISQLSHHAGNISAIARALGKKRAQIHRWLRRLELDAAQYREPATSPMSAHYNKA